MLNHEFKPMHQPQLKKIFLALVGALCFSAKASLALAIGSGYALALQNHIGTAGSSCNGGQSICGSTEQKNTILDGENKDSGTELHETQVWSGGYLSNNQVMNAGGQIVLNNNAQADNTVVGEAGLLDGKDQSISNSTVINYGGVVRLYDAAVSNAATVHGSSDSANPFAFGTLILNDSSAANGTVVKGGDLILNGNSSATNTTMAKGTDGSTLGTLSVKGQAQINSTTINSGNLNISEQGQAYQTEINEGFVLVHGKGASITETVNNGGRLVISDGATATNTTINQGEVSVVARGKAVNTTVNKGADFYIYEESSADGILIRNGGKNTLTIAGESGGPLSALTVINTIIEAGGLQDAAGGSIYVEHSKVYGTQNINNRAVVNYTQIYNGGIQNVGVGAIATDTHVYEGGKQVVYKNATARLTQVDAKGQQHIQSGAVANKTTVAAGAQQLVYLGGIANDGKIYGIQRVLKSESGIGSGVVNNTQIFAQGSQILENASQANNTQLFDQGTQKVLSGSVTKNTTLNQKAISFVDGDAAALGLTKVNDQAQLQLKADSTAQGAYAEKVSLNGPETMVRIVTSPTRETSLASAKVNIGDLSGNGVVKFGSADNTNGGFANLIIQNLSGSQHFFLNSSINDGVGDYIDLANASGLHRLTVQDSGAEIVAPGQTKLDLVRDQKSDAVFNLSSLNGSNIKAVDGGSYLYYLQSRTSNNGEKIWYLSPEWTPEPGTTDPEVPDPGKPKPPTSFAASNSTKAALALAAAPQYIFNNELNNLRFRKGALQANAGEGGIWGRTTGAQSKVKNGNTQFKLEQVGFEMGADKAFNSDHGVTLLGFFAGSGRADVKHALGGTSKVTSSTAGLYVSYFDQSGLYMDGVLKANHFSNKLQAISTGADYANINADYSQNAVGGALEVGFKQNVQGLYFVEPYARVSYAQIKGKNVAFSGKNSMKVKIDDQKSLMTEVGATIGKNIQLNQTLLTPYVKLAWAHEFKGDNGVTTNDKVDWHDNLSGSMGKVGAGINATIGKATTVFAEIDYANGHKVDAPIQGNIGLRYHF